MEVGTASGFQFLASNLRVFIAVVNPSRVAGFWGMTELIENPIKEPGYRQMRIEMMWRCCY